MGYGDKLMAIGDAWKQYQHDPLRRRVAIGDGRTIDPLDQELADGLDFLATPEFLAGGGEASWVISYRGHRPYFDYAAMARERSRYRPWLRFPPFRRRAASRLGHYIYRMDYRPTPAPIPLNAAEQEIAEHWSREPFVVIEPFIKPEAPRSKQWPVERFEAAARRLSRDIRVYQIGAPGSPELEGLPQIRPRSFRESMAYLRAARLFVGPEGGLHHASAAMGTKAVVIFGGFISPLVTGYDFHVNLTGGAEYACGTKRGMCPHCLAAFERITLDEVEAQARRLLSG